MWQTIVVLFVIAVVLIYVIRHYVSILRGRAPMCCGCSGECAAIPKEGFECECGGAIDPSTEQAETVNDQQTPG